MGRRRRAAPGMALSGYRLMWMMVLFDLPVGTDAERKHAHDFREALKDLGFVMAQYSVYLRPLPGAAAAEALSGQIRRRLPPGGRVYLHCLTDKQYERIQRYENAKRQPDPLGPQQYELF